MSKNIVVLCDGTWDGPSSKTNILKLYKELLELDNQQHVMYIDGVGIGEMTLNFIIDGAVARSLDKKIKDAYKYIVSRYSPGDNVWLFGFSRGAYTVRCAAGMIRNCGILQLDRVNQPGKLDQIVDLAYDMYRNRDTTYHPDGEGSNDFKKEFSHPEPEKPPIKFLGLWDTVGAHGIPGYVIGKGFEYLEFHDRIVPNVVNFACQALAIHERVTFLEPCRILKNSTSTVTIKETWFPGVHVELGGDTLLTFKGNERIVKATMLWMIENIFEVGGLLMRDNIENYRSRFSPDSGSSWNTKSLIFHHSNILAPMLTLKDRNIPLYVDTANPNMLKRGLLYRDGDWTLAFDDRKNLSHQYASNTYEELREAMEAKGIQLYNNIKYEKSHENAHKFLLSDFGKYYENIFSDVSYSLV